MAMVVSTPNDGIAKPPPPPPAAAVHGRHTKLPYNPYTGAAPAAAAAAAESTALDGDDGGLLGIVVVLRAAAAVLAFVAVALVASCRHGDWMEFARYHEYRYLLGVAVLASVYSALQALRTFRRMRTAGAYAASFLDFAGDQAVSYLLVTAASAALPITIRMRSAVVNTFTDAIAAAISLAFLAFAALAFAAMLAGFNLSAAYNHAYT